MPDKQNDNKFMAMLERRGIVRKTGSEVEDNKSIADPSGSQARPDADLRAMFGSPESDAPKVTPAARQPVPGLSTPLTPGERPPQVEREQIPPLHGQPIQVRPVERSEPVQAQAADIPAAESARLPEVLRVEPIIPPDIPRVEPPQLPDIPKVEPLKPMDIIIEDMPGLVDITKDEPTRPADIPDIDRPQYKEMPKVEPPMPLDIIKAAPLMFQDIPRAEPPMPVDMPRPDLLSPGFEFAEESISRERPLAATGEIDVPETPQQPSVEDYTDRYLDIDELYDVLSLPSKRTDTIFLVEEYIKTLPDSLPDDSRREIVRRIVSASGFDYDLLMGDGVLRVKMLKDYAERFARQTDEYIASRQAELDDLDQQIMRIRRLIEIRKGLHKKQFFAIEAEAQRLKEILTFISG